MSVGGNTQGKLVCSNCGKTGHVAAKCYLRDKEVRVNTVGSENRRGAMKGQSPLKGDIECYNCGEVATWPGIVENLDRPEGVRN
jgi:hypothetical protein